MRLAERDSQLAENRATSRELRTELQEVKNALATTRAELKVFQSEEQR